MFKIEYSESFCPKYLAKIPTDMRIKIKKFIENRIAAYPHEAGDPLKGTLVGLWRARVGDYRIIYEIQKDRVIVRIIKIGHRKDIYDRDK